GDILDRSIHANRVDRAVGGDRADHDRHVVGATAAVTHFREQKRPAVSLIETSDELPAHQRMQFSVFVDRAIDGEQQALLAQRIEVLVQIAIAARGPRNRARALDVSGFASGPSPRLRASSYVMNSCSASPPLMAATCSAENPAAATTFMGERSPIGNRASEPSMIRSVPPTSARSRRPPPPRPTA